MKSLLQLQKNLKLDFSDLTPVKIALLGDTSTQFLGQALRGAGYDYGLNLDIFESDYNQIERQIFDQGSELYSFAPEIIIIFQSTHKLLNNYNKQTVDDRIKLAYSRLQLIDELYQNILKGTKAKIIYYNYPEIDDSIFGNFSNKTESSFLFQLRKLNYELMLYATNHPDFHICDISSIQNQLGKTTLFHPSLYVNSDMVLSFDSLPFIANRSLDIIAAVNGKFKKCIILDLDNTLWGGVIGDDGIDNIEIGSLGIGKAFTEFQYWIKKLKTRGIILAICSKNTEKIAKEPFEKHPEMVIHLDDIAVFVSNWNTKVENIKQIQDFLNIGFDSMVFIDDNPFERTLVKKNIPEITVPELPEDPAEYLEFLYSLNLFETVTFSKEDTSRTMLYKTEYNRSAHKMSFADENEFLQSLNMVSVVQPFNSFNTPRIAQLTQRSNQFNLRTIRYSQSDIESISKTKNVFTFSFTLEDKFGDNGLICVVILRKMDTDNVFIDTWLMSCRILKRGVENFVLNTLADFTNKKGFNQLTGEYIQTPKNEIVRDLYKNLGFTQEGNLWTLDLNKYQNRTCQIKHK